MYEKFVSIIINYTFIFLLNCRYYVYIAQNCLKMKLDNSASYVCNDVKVVGKF